MVVIKALNEHDAPLSSIGPWIEDAKTYANSFFPLLHCHTRKECNSLAHNLARYVIDILDFLVWMENVSPYVTTVLQNDLARLV